MCTKSGLHVNVSLLPVKVTYFLLFAAVAVLLPYLPVYMKALGLTPAESAIILSVTTAATGLVRAVIGVLADKLHCHRLFIVVCCLAGGIFHFGILFVPPAMSEISTDSGGRTWNVCCRNSRLFACGRRFAAESKSENFSLRVDAGAPLLDTAERIQMWSCILQCCRVTQNVTDATAEANTSSCSMVTDLNLMLSGNCAGDLDGCSAPLNLSESVFAEELCKLASDGGCSVTCSDSSVSAFHPQYSHSKFERTFAVVFILFFVGQSAFSPIFNLLDSIVYIHLGDRHGEFGKQRLWGTVSFGIFTLSTGFIMDALQQNTNRNSYLYSFIAFLLLLILTGGSVYFYKSTQIPKTDGAQRNLRALLCNFFLAVAYSAMLVAGIFSGVLEAFFFWFLKMIGAEQSVFGVALSVSCILEAIVLFFSGRIIAKLGSSVCLYIVFAAYTVRLLANSFIEHPWVAVATEATQSICFGLLYPTVTAWGSTLVPPGMQGSVQGIMGAMYLSIGRAVGAALGGVFFEAYSPRTMFRIFAIVSFVYLVILVILLEAAKRRQSHATAEDVANASAVKSHDQDALQDDNHLPRDETMEELLESSRELPNTDSKNGPGKENVDLVSTNA